MIWETGRPVRRNTSPKMPDALFEPSVSFFFFSSFDTYQSFIVYLGSKLWKTVAMSFPHHQCSTQRQMTGSEDKWRVVGTNDLDRQRGYKKQPKRCRQHLLGCTR